MTNSISSLIGSRICHDLISPIGAIGNGLELLSMSLQATGPELSLIEDSVKNANARIRFFRVAFGNAEAGQHIGRSEVLSVLSGMAYGGRFTYFWRPEGDLDRVDVRIAFLLLQCFETALPYGGEVEIVRNASGWQLTARGRKLVVEPRLWDSVSQGPVDNALSAAEVQFALLPIILADADKSLTVEHTQTEITARF